jgi:drug/metabolite transporter (DMT)-like permease
MPSLSILLAIFLWSSLGVVVRLSGVQIHVLMFYSLVVAVIVQGLILTRKSYRKDFPGIGKLRYPIILGCISLVNTFTFYYAFQHTTIANAVLTHYTAPIIVAILAPFMLKERITGRIIAVIMFASAGLWIMSDGLSVDKSHMMGIAAGLVSGVAYALIVILLRMHAQKFRPLVFVLLVNIVIILLLAPFIREFPVHGLWSYLFMGIIHSTIAPIIYFRGLQQVTANRAAVLGYLEPVCAIVIAMLFLNEIPGTHSVIGGILIIFSGYLTLRGSDTYTPNSDHPHAGKS